MAAKDLRTIFVRGVSFDADEKALEELFSDVGPVKQCFLVRVKGQPRHRGFGFVQYALPEDAERAVTECDGKPLKGRKLQVELADKRAPLEERKKKRKLDQDGAADVAEHADGDAAGEHSQRPGAKDQTAKPPAAAAAAEKKPVTAGKGQPDAEPSAGAAKAKAAPPRKRQCADGAAAGGAGTGAASEKHKLLRAVAIGNLTPAAITQAIVLARKAAPVEEVMNPAPADVVQAAKLEADGCSGNVIIVVYKTVKDAMHAVTQLHNKSLELRGNNQKGQQQQQKKKKKGRKGKQQQQEEEEEEAGDDDEEGEQKEGEEEDPQRSITLWAREVKGEGAHVKQWRVILRNLPFKITEAALVKALQPVGFVWELKLPRGPDGRLKGFAFAAFTCRAHAEKAISLLNGKDLLGRMVVVDWAVSKTQYLQTAGGATAAAATAGGGGGEADGPGGKDAEEGLEDPDRPPSGSEEEDDDADGGEDDGEDEEDEGEEEEIGLSSDDDGEVLDDDDEEDDDEEDEEDEEEPDDDDEEEEEEEEAVEGEEVDARRERGMLNDVMAAVLAEHEQPRDEQTAAAGKGGKAGAAAPAAAAKAGKQPKLQEQPQQQQQKRQTWQGEEAEDLDAVDDDDDAEAQRRAGQSTSAAKKPSSSSLNTTVFVRGLPLDATREQLQARLEVFGPVKACRLVMDKASGKAKGTAFVEYKEEEPAAKAAAACARGRRNEGPGITLAGRQIEVDLAVSGEDARSLVTQRLASKSSSRDRRNMYLAKEGHITEGSPAWNGMSAHDQARRKRAAEEKNVKLRSPNFVVSRTRLSVRNIPPGWSEAQLRRLFVAAVKERATKEEPRVVQAKILREQDKYDASGARKSKGLGFVEFESHDHALVALRQLNNNPGTPWGRERRPIVEFAIDNVKVLKKIENFREKAKARQQQQPAGGKAEQEEADGAAATAAANGNGGRKGRKERMRSKRGAEANDGATETEVEAGKSAPKGKKEGGQQKRRAEAAGGDGEEDADGGGEGAAMSKRQRKRQRQKERVERKKVLLKEGGVKALVEAVEAEKQQRQQGAGDGKAGNAAAAKGAQGARKNAAPAKSQPQRQKQPQPTQKPQQPPQQQRKRRAEEDEMDRIANQGLAATASARGGGAAPAKRRRPDRLVEEGEGGDRLDRLVEQYRAKLAGDRPNKNSNSNSNAKGGRAGAKGGKAGAKGGAAAGAKGGAAAAGAKGGKGAGGGGGGSGVAALVAGAVQGGLRRWFDG